MPTEATVLPYDRLLEKAAAQHVPIRAMMELTQKCNLRCSHCYLAPSSGTELTGAEIKRVMRDLASLGTMVLTLTGGEVLLREDFLELCWHARRLGFALHIKTNGTLLDDWGCEEIARLDPVKVDVSIYHSRAAEHDEVTGVEGSHAASTRAIKWLAAQGAPVFVNTVLMRANADDYPNIRTLAHSLGAGFQIDPVVLVKTDGSRATVACRADDASLRGFISDMYSRPVSSADSQVTADERAQMRPCFAGSTTVVVSADGTVNPCAVLNLPCGNVRDDSICTIWRTSRELELVRGTRVSDAVACGECDLDAYCYRCMGLAYLEDGDLRGCSSEARRQAAVYKSTVEATANTSV